MRIFIRVVERGSMSAAARDLGIGQPAVSERIEKLEAHLGTRLLRRNTRNMSLTQSGNVFYERSKTAVQAAEHALSVNEENQGLQGKIRIAAPYSAGESLLMPALLQLQNEHPALQVDVIFNDRVIDPVTEGVDLSLRTALPWRAEDGLLLMTQSLMHEINKRSCFCRQVTPI